LDISSTIHSPKEKYRWFLIHQASNIISQMKVISGKYSMAFYEAEAPREPQ
jgi:hypothetical protein